MSHDNEALREILTRIAELANEAASAIGQDGDSELGETGGDEIIVCTPKTLPKRLWVKAADVARQVNPVNAPSFGPMASLGEDFGVMDPLRIAVLTAKYWGPAQRRLTVSFMESTASNLRTRIIGHMNAWSRTIGITFVATNQTGDVRISRGAGGYWSYLGTDIRLIPRNRQTMNLQGFTMNTSESEYKRVVRHETGHTLGFPHEHMRRALVARIDRERAYAYFLRTQGWDRATVDAQVLTPLDERSIMATPADQTSIMCYQLPGSIMRDGRPITGGIDINTSDFSFAGTIYPRAGHTPAATAEEMNDDDWPESEDPEIDS